MYSRHFYGEKTYIDLSQSYNDIDLDDIIAPKHAIVTGKFRK